jgi:hypothetical protein
VGLILTAVEVIGGTAGMALICHRIEQMMLAAKGYDTRDFFRPIRGPSAAEKPATALPPPLWSDTDARRAAEMFIENPLAFWLDPNLWGDDPNWRERLFPTPTEPLISPVMRMRAHIDKRKGKPDDSFPDLPCGCPWETTITRMREPYTGWHVTRCNRCKAEWEPASNDPTGRRLGQGERVHPAGYTAKVAAERDEWGDDIVRKQLADLPRGSCPSCGRSHPQCHTPLDPSTADGWGESFLRCTQCAHEWPIPWVPTADGGWRKRRTPAEIKARRKAEKRAKRLANRDDYDSELPAQPWTGGPRKPKGTIK